MTFISTLGSFAFTSLWVFLLGTPLVGKTIPIPYRQIAISLASFTVPLIAGVAFKVWKSFVLELLFIHIPQYKWSKQAAILRQTIARPFFFIVLITLPIIAISNNIHFFYLCTWRHAVSGACLGFLGLLFGAGFAALLKQKRPQVRV